jgi:transcriptional regulator with XRE-family HTH domain
MKEEFSKRLTLLRKEKGITQKQAAQDLNVSQALLSHYEKGIRECGLEFVARACEYYKVSSDYLLGLSQMTGGEKLSSDLPDPAAEPAANTGDLALGLGRRIVFNGLDLLYLTAGQTNREFVRALNNYMYLSVYKAFRALYDANPQNNRNLFMIEPSLAPFYTEAALAEQTAQMNAALQKGDLPDLGQTHIEQQFPNRAGGMLNLIKNAENLIKR